MPRVFRFIFTWSDSLMTYRKWVVKADQIISMEHGGGSRERLGNDVILHDAVVHWGESRESKIVNVGRKLRLRYFSRSNCPTDQTMAVPVWSNRARKVTGESENSIDDVNFNCRSKSFDIFPPITSSNIGYNF